MRKIIEDLYHGDMAPYTRVVIPDSAYAETSHAIMEIEKEIMTTLSAEMQTQFTAYCNARSKLLAMEAEETFVTGYRLGAQMMLAMLMDDTKNLRPLA